MRHIACPPAKSSARAAGAYGPVLSYIYDYGIHHEFSTVTVCA